MNILDKDGDGSTKMSFDENDILTLKQSVKTDILSAPSDKVPIELAKLTLWLFQDNHMLEGHPMWYGKDTSTLIRKILNQ